MKTHVHIVTVQTLMALLTAYVTEAWCNLAACFCKVARKNASSLSACILQRIKREN